MKRKIIRERKVNQQMKVPLISLEKNPRKAKQNCLTKSDLQELEVLYNNPEELENDKIPDVIEKLSSTISEL